MGKADHGSSCRRLNLSPHMVLSINPPIFIIVVRWFSNAALDTEELPAQDKNTQRAEFRRWRARPKEKSRLLLRFSQHQSIFFLLPFPHALGGGASLLIDGQK
ncbi:hypothetical protein HDK77DRAFT_438109 [Phyllosticta capitalensis]|uniref:Uncharacterized protein n=1 Tax=Phyllosticta capitalensis TaxID=121624 RepID=A0ABR1YUU9_9PEZI